MAYGKSPSFNANRIPNNYRIDGLQTIIIIQILNTKQREAGLKRAHWWRYYHQCINSSACATTPSYLKPNATTYKGKFL